MRFPAAPFLFLALVAVALPACRTERAAIVVEADTAAMADPARPDPVSAPAPREAEVVVVEEAAPAAAQPPSTPRDEAPAAERAEAPASAPDEEAAAPAVGGGPLVLPAGFVLPLELRTPLHSGTTRVGDRFAARTVEAVVVDGRTALAAGVLVEGKVADVVRAGAEEPGAIEVDFRSVVLPDGERVALGAEIASVAGRPAGEPRSASARQVVGGAASGAVLGGAMGGGRGAVIGAAVGAIGATLVAGATDHEVVVPPGTRIDLELTRPLELPAGPADRAP